MRKKFGIFLMTIGILLLALYFAARLIPNYYSENDISKDISSTEMEQNNKKEFKNDFDAVNSISTTTSLFNFTAISGENVIGQIIIPDYNLSLPIHRGVTDEHLLSGAATMKENQKMGEKNYTLTGHYMKRNGSLFSKVYDLTKGTKVYITDKKNIYEYEIVDRKVTDSYAFYMLEDDRIEKYDNKPILSLMTCDMPNDPNNRVFQIGKLVRSFKYDKNYFKQN